MDANQNLVDDTVESKIATEKLKDDYIRTKVRWLVRRRFAITAFVYNLLIGIAYLLLPLVMSTEQSTNLKDYNSIIVAIIGANVSIIMIYIGAVTISDHLTDKMNQGSNDENQ